MIDVVRLVCIHGICLSAQAIVGKSGSAARGHSRIHILLPQVPRCCIGAPRHPSRSSQPCAKL